MTKFTNRYNHNEEEDEDGLQQREDLVESTIGSFGRFQFLISLCMALLKLPIAWFQLGIVFLAPPTEFWCRQPEDYRMYSKEKWLDHIKPYNFTMYQNTTGENQLRCVMRNIELDQDHKVQACKWGMEYDRSIFETSIITDWNLVCGKEHFVDLTQSVLMFGVLVGNAVFGILADKFGRKKILIICIIMQATCSLISTWMPWVELFLVLRFLLAMANGGTMITSFVLCMEVVGGKWRRIVPILYQIPFGLGNTIMALLAYYIRNWREFQVALSFLSGTFIIYAWIVPESPRWLMTMGRRKEACTVLENAAEMNGIDVMRVRSRLITQKTYRLDDRTSSGFSSLVATPNIRFRTIFLTMNWLLCGMTLYGFTQYLGHLGTNIYFNVSVGGLITIPGTLLCVVIVGRFGRRLTIMCANFWIAACFLCIMLTPVGAFANDWPRVVFAALGILGLSVATPTLYLFTGELYPTIMRNVGVGACIMFSRIGSMFSPFIVSLGQNANYLPLVVLIALSLTQGLSILPLPEPSDKLMDTISDCETSSGLRQNRRNDERDNCLYEHGADDNPIMD